MTFIYLITIFIYNKKAEIHPPLNPKSQFRNQNSEMGIIHSSTPLWLFQVFRATQPAETED